MSDPATYMPGQTPDRVRQWNLQLPSLYAVARKLFPEYEQFSDKDFENQQDLRLEAALRLDHMAWDHGDSMLQKDDLEEAMRLAIGKWDQDERTLLNGPLIFLDRYIQSHQDPFKFYASLGFDTGKIVEFLKRIRGE